MDIVERFLKYVSFDTQSAEDAGKTPSTDKQLKLAEYLKQELTELGMTEVELDANGYVYATFPPIPINPCLPSALLPTWTPAPTAGEPT